jgi:hypothetical protein
MKKNFIESLLDLLTGIIDEIKMFKSRSPVTREKRLRPLVTRFVDALDGDLDGDDETTTPEEGKNNPIKITNLYTDAVEICGKLVMEITHDIRIMPHQGKWWVVWAEEMDTISHLAPWVIKLSKGDLVSIEKSKVYYKCDINVYAKDETENWIVDKHYTIDGGIGRIRTLILSKQEYTDVNVAYAKIVEIWGKR